MVNIVKTFSWVHDVSQNNILIGDFNFADIDVDKGKGMSDRDEMMNSTRDEFKSEEDMVDPFRVQSPKRRIYSFVRGGGGHTDKRRREDEVEPTQDVAKVRVTGDSQGTPYKTAPTTDGN